MMLLLARAEWTLGIGDPTIIGWTVCAAYAYASWRCLTAGAQANTTRAAGLTRFWLACAFVLLLLSLNKQLDLQKIFTQMARALAREQGWYKSRKPVQFAVLGAALLIVLALSCWMMFLLRTHWRKVAFALGGFFVISTYIAMRATSHHDIDALMRAGPVPLRDSMELCGIALICWGTRQSRRPL